MFLPSPAFIYLTRIAFMLKRVPDLRKCSKNLYFLMQFIFQLLLHYSELYREETHSLEVICVQYATLNCSESIWPPPFSTGVYRNEEPSPKGQRDKEIPLSQFILSLFEGVGQLLPGRSAHEQTQASRS